MIKANYKLNFIISLLMVVCFTQQLYAQKSKTENDNKEKKKQAGNENTIWAGKLLFTKI